MNPVNPTLLVRLRRKITGIAAMRLPFLDWGDIDWGDIDWGDIDWGNIDWGNIDWRSYDRYLLRTDAAGLTSAINLEMFGGRMSIPLSVGLKHSSFPRKPEWQRLPLNVILPSPSLGDTQTRDTA